MKSNRFVGRLLRSTVMTSAIAVLAAPALAQDVDQIPDAEEVAQDQEDTIIVTGSRLRRDAFNSPSPLTTLDVDANRELGVANIAELLTRSTVTGGQQIDNTLNTNAGNSNATEAPPAGGTGSSNVNLRGLGPERTLILLNGRRLGATGVRGAPSQPDLNLIPFSMVERVDVVTEAGSSIYGADAVAGTVNVILKSDFEGFEIVGSGEVPEADGGRQYQIGFIAGAQGDRARITFGGEYFDRQRVSAGDRSFSSSLRDIEVDADGNLFIAPISGFFDNNGFDQNFNVVCFQPGANNGIDPPDYTNCGNLTPPAGFEDLGDSNFIYFPEFNDQFERAQADLIQPLERFSLLTQGEVDLDWFGSNNQFYFEAFYTNRQQFVKGATEQIFPEVPGQIEQRDANGNTIVDASGNPILVDNPLNPFAPGFFVPIVTLEDLPQTFDVELQQVRFVSGMRGDIPAGWFGENRWTYDTYFSYDRGTGFVAQPILFEPHLAASLNYFLDTTDNTIKCDPIAPNTDIFGFSTPPDCVVFDALNPSVFIGGPNGDGAFSTQAEKDFLVGNRTNRTAIEQYISSTFVQGDLMESPWGGTVTAGFGFEYRQDRIVSQNSIVGVLGLNAAENPVPEGETIGNRDFFEFFHEMNIPLIVDRPGVKLLNIDGAVRYTDESNFGDDVTFRGRLQYKPVDYFGISGGYGTSFRAPNLREQFLADQGGGISGFLDPCNAANIDAAVTASGDTDPDVQLVINNCIADGIIFTDSDANGNPDTTTLGASGTVTIPTSSGGNPDLNPEESRTFTVTAQFEQPWYEGFSFSLAASYYDIKITNSVEEPGAGLIFSKCYSDPDFPNLTSPFCSLVDRTQGGDNTSRFINNVDLTFFNIGEITSRGIDINTRFNTDLPIEFDGEPVNFSMSTATSYVLEQEQQTFDPSDRDDNLNEIGTPQFRINVGTNFSWGEFSLVSEHRRIGRQFEDVSESFRDNPFFTGVQLTRDLDFVDAVWYHDVALTWAHNNFSISGGVNNIADREPPLIDDSEGPNRNNAVSTAGYDFFGRSYFVTGRIAF